MRKGTTRNIGTICINIKSSQTTCTPEDAESEPLVYFIPRRKFDELFMKNS
jgi:hypothetical protein